MLSQKAQRIIALDNEGGGEFPEITSSIKQEIVHSTFPLVDGKPTLLCPKHDDPWTMKADLQTADNILTVPMLTAHIAKADQICDSDAMYGLGTGHIELKELVIKLFQRTFFKYRELSPKKMIISNGAGPLISMAVDCFCNDGDPIIIIAPYWGNFTTVVEALSHAKIYPTKPSSTDDFKFHEHHLTEALCRAERELGPTKPVRCVILTSPTNPTGHVYREDELDTIFRWCESRKIHLIVDEIYALSTYSGNFTSISDRLLKLGYPTLSPYVHIVWSFSKDFNISGFRVGVFYTEDSDLYTFMEKLSYLFRSSTLSQFALRHFLSYPMLVDKFTAENRINLLASYKAVEETLTEHQIKFIPAHAGFFVFIDLSELNIDDEELHKKMGAEADIWLSMGTKMGIVDHGWFRIAFAAYSKEIMQVFMHRLGRFVKKQRELSQK